MRGAVVKVMASRERGKTLEGGKPRRATRFGTV
jgi:hypothetical protein